MAIIAVILIMALELILCLAVFVNTLVKSQLGNHDAKSECEVYSFNQTLKN